MVLYDKSFSRNECRVMLLFELLCDEESFRSIKVSGNNFENNETREKVLRIVFELRFFFFFRESDVENLSFY